MHLHALNEKVISYRVLNFHDRCSRHVHTSPVSETCSQSSETWCGNVACCMLCVCVCCVGELSDTITGIQSHFCTVVAEINEYIGFEFLRIGC